MKKKFVQQEGGINVMRKYTKKEYRALKRAGKPKERRRKSLKYKVYESDSDWISSVIRNYNPSYRTIRDYLDKHGHNMTTTESVSSYAGDYTGPLWF